MAKRTIPTEMSKRKLKAVNLSPSSGLSSGESSGGSPELQPQPLSLKEKGVLEFLESYIASQGVSPTYQEICQHFGFASFNSVQRYLKQLESKGYIQLPWSNQKRAITILHTASTKKNDLLQKSPESLLPAILPSESLSLPLLGRVAAGAPIEALEDDEFIDVPASLVRKPDRTYALRVQGQSMIEDGIFDGDVILVQRQDSAQNGEIVVAVVNEEATVKRFHSHRDVKAVPAKALDALLERLSLEGEGDGDGVDADSAAGRNRANQMIARMIELRPANSSMSSMWYDSREVEIRGVVVGLIRRFF
jgi:repressor LexA